MAAIMLSVPWKQRPQSCHLCFCSQATPRLTTALSGKDPLQAAQDTYRPDVVLWWQRLKDRDGEGHAVGGLAGHLLGQCPQLRVVDVLILRVFHPDVPALGVAVHALPPLKGRLNRQLHT